jgi:phosphoribosyl 1,2-cyclic phosphodiesterase
VSGGASLRLCVLSSSSAGNSSALLVGEGDGRGIILIDAGLSPRQTRKMLALVDATEREVTGVVLTHLDGDHFHAGWLRFLRRGVPVWVHRSHLGRAERDGIALRRTEVFTDTFEPAGGVTFRAAVLSHDSLGVACFRIESSATGRTLGYATDVGRPAGELIAHLKGVDVLAIESNYCPRLQVASGRPEFLKRRIMGGSGHLSNQQSADAVRLIAPRERVVLLHLSVQCNRPELAAEAHRGHGVPLEVSRPDAPTGWIDVSRPGQSPGVEREAPMVVARTLWEGVGT